MADTAITVVVDVIDQATVWIEWAAPYDASQAVRVCVTTDAPETGRRIRATNGPWLSAEEQRERGM